jgi:hypothetical protein
MSQKDYLAVRFHFEGKIVNDGKTFEYVGGEDAMSMILRGSCGIAEIHRHLTLHHKIINNEMLHWLMPGKGLFDGLCCLTTDDACMVMLKHIPIDGVVNIYVEEPGEQLVEPNQTMDSGFFENEIPGRDSRRRSRGQRSRKRSQGAVELVEPELPLGVGNANN